MSEMAQLDPLGPWLQQLIPAWERFQRFEHTDAMSRRSGWLAALNTPLPQQGAGLGATLATLANQVIPNGSAVPRPEFFSWITTGPVHAALLARWSADLAAPQRIGLNAFTLLEDVALEWLRTLFELTDDMQGVFTAGGASANLIALGAARQHAFEQLGVDVAESGLPCGGVIFASSASHRTVHRAAATLGLGRAGICEVDVDRRGRMRMDALAKALRIARADGGQVPVAVVANAGATSTGAIDPLDAMADLCEEYAVWLHVDGAYGLPGLLDPLYHPQFRGLERASSVCVDPHKWMGAPVGTGAVFVRSAALLARSFAQGSSDYLEGSFSHGDYQHSMDHPGTPYSDYGIDLSAPARGVVVWALLNEIGVDGLRERICRHNAMARELGERVRLHPRLELLIEVSLSICCFRYLPTGVDDINSFNRQLHRRLIHKGNTLPSTAVINGQFGLRPCFIGARTEESQIDALLDDVLTLGSALEQEHTP